MAATMTIDSRAAQRAYMKEWRQKNRDKVKEYNARYWAKKAKQGSEDNGGNR